MAGAADPSWRPVRLGASSTYVARPPFFDSVSPLSPAALADIVGARALAVLSDSVTTDHISPAGSIAPSSPAGRWLQEHDVSPLEFNSYGARRGHHEVMMRGTFGNIRLHNGLVDGKEGPYTIHLPDGEEMFIFDAAMRYRDEGVPLMIIAGREYGSGSSRDWAAKGTTLLASTPSSPRATSGSTVRTWSGWGSCHSNSCRVTARRRSVSRVRSPSRSRASPPVSRRAASSLWSPETTAMATNAHSRSWPASTARSTSTTTVTVASCPPSSAVWRLQAERRSQARASSPARRRTASSIGGVSLPVNVFRWLGWNEPISWYDPMTASVPCPKLRSRSRDRDRAIDGDRPKRRVPGECAEGDDDADATQSGEFANEVRGAVITLTVRRTVHRWRAADSGGDVEIGQCETISGPN